MANTATGSIDRERKPVGRPRFFKPEDWLSLAAAPIFAAIALALWWQEDSMRAIVCSAKAGSPFGSMRFMYCLMCASHLPPWLRLLRNWSHG